MNVMAFLISISFFRDLKIRSIATMIISIINIFFKTFQIFLESVKSISFSIRSLKKLKRF
jgi:hypothetical protein